MVNNIQRQIKILEKHPNYRYLLSPSIDMPTMKGEYMFREGISHTPPQNRHCEKYYLNEISLLYESINRYRDYLFVFYSAERIKIDD